MLYKTLSALSLKGDRIETGKIIEVDEETFAQIGPRFLEKVNMEPAPEVKKPVKVIDDKLSLEELKAEAKARGLSDKGRKSDLIERIQLSAK